MQPFQKLKARQVVDSGGVIAYPTESVYGLGCDPLNFDAVKKLLDLKQRPLSKGLILVASSVEQLSNWVQPLSAEVKENLNKFWPGPYNLVLPAHKDIPIWITGGRKTIAIRVSEHPFIKEFCDHLGHPLVSTSANLSGHPPQNTSIKVQKQLGSKLDLIIPGKSGGLSPCPIIIAQSLRKLRD